MKNICRAVLSVVVIVLSCQTTIADPCQGTTVFYPYEQGIGWFKIYTYAVNPDGSTPPQYHSGINNRDLTVTWDKAGTGTLYFYELMFDGSEYNLYQYVNVANCLSFSGIPVYACNNASLSLTLSDTNGSSTYTYTVPSGWTINGGSNVLTTSSTSISVGVSSSAQGYNPITVTSNNSGNRTYNLWIGLPDNTTTNAVYAAGHDGSNPVTLSLNTTYAFFVHPVAGADAYTWTLPTGFSWGSGPTTGSPVNITTAAYTGSFNLYCRAQNSCGFRRLTPLVIDVTSGGPIERLAAPEDDPEFSFSPTIENTVTDTPYPIPAIGDIHVTLSEHSKVTLIDLSGRSLYNALASGKVTIPVRQYTPGFYIVTIHNTKIKKAFKVLVGH